MELDWRTRFGHFYMYAGNDFEACITKLLSNITSSLI